MSRTGHSSWHGSMNEKLVTAVAEVEKLADALQQQKAKASHLDLAALCAQYFAALVCRCLDVLLRDPAFEGAVIDLHLHAIPDIPAQRGLCIATSTSPVCCSC
jgi:hypothetical protein